MNKTKDLITKKDMNEAGRKKANIEKVGKVHFIGLLTVFDIENSSMNMFNSWHQVRINN